MAVRVMDVPDGKLAVQVVGQLIPAGLLVTVPVPVTATVSRKFCGGGGLLLLDVLQALRINAEDRTRKKAKRRELKRGQPLSSWKLGAQQSSWVAFR